MSFICFALLELKMSGPEDSFSEIQDAHRRLAKSWFGHRCGFGDLPRSDERLPQLRNQHASTLLPNLGY
jgi:hypothetical protein